MSLFKNKVGRPTNEIKKKRNFLKIGIIVLVVLLILIFSLFIIENKSSNNKNLYTIGMTGDKVNSELKNVYAFKFLEDDLKIVALTTDNKEIEIANDVDNIHSISYYNGKIYYNYDSFKFGAMGDAKVALIDLGQGNGNYEQDYIVIDKELGELYTFGVIDGNIYYQTLDDNYLRSYNINDKTISVIDGDEVGSSSFYGTDNKYNKIYYSIEDSRLIEYDTKTNKKKKIYKPEKGEISILMKSNHKIIYTNSYTQEDFYMYDIESSKTKKLDSKIKIDPVDKREIFYID